MGMLVFGRVTKGGAGVAGEYGEGVLRVDGRRLTTTASRLPLSALHWRGSSQRGHPVHDTRLARQVYEQRKIGLPAQTRPSPW